MNSPLPISLAVRIEHWPIAGSFTISRGAKTQAAVVVAELSDGHHRGRGECVPYGRYGETIDGVAETITALADEIARGLDRGALQKAMRPGAARNALDCAFWDLSAKRAGKAVHELAGLPPPKPLVTAYTISLAEPDVMAEQAGKAAGRALLKVKLGSADDRARIMAVRRAAPNAELIVDAIVFSDPAFTGPLASAPPARVAPNASFLEPVTFRPTGGPDRSVDGSLSITHNVAGTASIVVQEVVPLCGESVGRGIRVLVLDPAGNTYSTVDRITLQSFGLKKKINVDVRDAPLTTIMPPASCQEIDFHYENQDLPAAGTAVHKGSYYALKVTQGNKSTSLSFTLNANEFKTIVVTVG